MVSNAVFSETALRILFILVFYLLSVKNIGNARDLLIYSGSQSAIQSVMWQNRAADPTCAAFLDMGILHNIYDRFGWF